MSYQLKPTNKPLEIKECEYATSHEVRFTYFDSCIGVLGYKDNNVTGVHLVLSVGENPNYPFNEEVAKDICDRVMPGKQEYVLIGDIALWTGTTVDPSVKKGVTYLRNNLKPLKEFQFGKGQYGGRVSSGENQISYYDDGWQYLDI